MLLNSALISLFLSTPSARRATGAAQCEEVSGCISIHALREEGDWQAGSAQVQLRYFYPRPPRGGRRPLEINAYKISDISIHALREEGDGCADFHSLCVVISIHALREEGDGHSVPDGKSSGAISIHALREEGDQWPEFSRNPF